MKMRPCFLPHAITPQPLSQSVSRTRHTALSAILLSRGRGCCPPCCCYSSDGKVWTNGWPPEVGGGGQRAHRPRRRQGRPAREGAKEDAAVMKHANSRLTTTTTPQAALLLTMTILAGLVFSKNQVSLAAPNQQEIGFKTTNTPTSSLHSHIRLTAQLFPSKTVSRRQLPLSGTPRANSTRHTHTMETKPTASVARQPPMSRAIYAHPGKPEAAWRVIPPVPTSDAGCNRESPSARSPPLSPSLVQLE